MSASDRRSGIVGGDAIGYRTTNHVRFATGRGLQAERALAVDLQLERLVTDGVKHERRTCAFEHRCAHSPGNVEGGASRIVGVDTHAPAGANEKLVRSRGNEG